MSGDQLSGDQLDAERPVAVNRHGGFTLTAIRMVPLSGNAVEFRAVRDADADVAIFRLAHEGNGSALLTDATSHIRSREAGIAAAIAAAYVACADVPASELRYRGNQPEVVQAFRRADLGRVAESDGGLVDPSEGRYSCVLLFSRLAR